MKENPVLTPEATTYAFFDRPAFVVADELSEKVYSKSVDGSVITGGAAKIIQVTTPQGEKTFKITLVQPYEESDAIRVWKGKRLEQIRSLAPGDVIAYQSRAGVLSFIKTLGGENIFIKELEDTSTGEKTKSSTRVTGILGLSHGSEGKLIFAGEDRLRFERRRES